MESSNLIDYSANMWWSRPCTTIKKIYYWGIKFYKKKTLLPNCGHLWKAKRKLFIKIIYLFTIFYLFLIFDITSITWVQSVCGHHPFFWGEKKDRLGKKESCNSTTTFGPIANLMFSYLNWFPLNFSINWKLDVQLNYFYFIFWIP
jgi:hypothetical protein